MINVGVLTVNNMSILNFRSRNNGNCAAISRFVTDYRKNTNICAYSIVEHFSPCKDCDYGCLKPGSVCPHNSMQKEVLDTVMKSDII